MHAVKFYGTATQTGLPLTSVGSGTIIPSMRKTIIQQTIDDSLNATMTFPQVIQLLLQEGIESYHVDIIRGENRYYGPNEESHAAKIDFVHENPPASFSAEQVNSAVRKVQAGNSNYRMFMDEITKAGCVYYVVYLTGKKVVYMGRNGESHVELFPPPKT